MDPIILVTVAIAALLGGLIGAWLTGRRNDPDGARRLAILMEQSARAARDDTEALRKLVADVERALTARVEDGLRGGFDRTLATIDTFRGDVAGVTAAMTRLGSELPTAFSAEGTRTKIEAAEANKTLRDSLAAALHQLGLEQGTRIEAFGEKVEASGVAVAAALGEMRTQIARFGGDMNTALAENQTRNAKALTEDFAKLIAHVDGKINEMREGNEAKLLQIQGVVDQKLQEGIEKRMTENFARIATQFAEVQQAVGEVKTVAGQVGDLKRLFSNVKSRGGWGEAQVKATLDDVLPPGSYETNVRVNPATADLVEFALKLPVQGTAPVYLAIDAKFPVEDYTRLLAAADAGDAAAEKAAKTALETQIRLEAKKIQAKYIAPPHTVEWAIMYLPSEGLYTEVTRNAELMEAIHRDNRVIVMGPSLLAVMLRTIQLGHYTLAISQKADLIGQILGAVKHEMVEFGRQFQLLERNVQALGNNIKKGQTRARVITRRLKDVSAVDGPAAAALLELSAEEDEDVEGEAVDQSAIG